ncbi:uncharacterized protein K02A2.6-like [Anastrepha ludens]|uniref:uncharacterized protein K02A2.6-like n=1 Tax=Anastrepha ludens TaxID=28586 RepID=UPI0023B0F153|nr:uncharacterized protein K02A2.6-like [Anastrepha ludens]
MHIIDKGNAPLLTIHIDHLGPLDATTKLYKHILIVVDGFSKFTWLYPTKTTPAEEVIRKMSEWANIFGAPHRIISDKGLAFTSTAFKDWCQTEKVEHVLTTSGVPRGNGQVERLNRVVINVISKLSADRTEAWYKYVGKVQRVINSTINKSTKYPPFEIMFGVKMKTPMDVNINNMVESETADILIANRDSMRGNVRRQIVYAQKEYKENFDRRRKCKRIYKLGDLVAIKRSQFVAGKKLANEDLGPYEVIRVKRNDKYDVKKAADFEGPNATSTSCDYMKPWKRDESDLSETDDIVEWPNVGE